MPIPLNTIARSEKTVETINKHLFDWVVNDELDGKFYDKSKRNMQMSASCKDAITNEDIVRVVFTAEKRGNEVRIVDTNVVSKKEYIKNFKVISRAKDAYKDHDFYNVIDTSSMLALQIMAVNEMVYGEELEGKTVDAAITLYPFQIKKYASIEAYNLAKGLTGSFIPMIDGKPGKEVKRAVSEDYTCPGYAVGGKIDHIFSVVLGRVLSTRECTIDFNGKKVDCNFLEIKSKEGRLPVIYAKSFNKSVIKVGDLLELYCDVVADLAVGEKSYYEK